jgi:valyl-tRNA synthetase
MTHPVKFFEKGDKPLEIVTTRQWYISKRGKRRRPQAASAQRGKEVHSTQISCACDTRTGSMGSAGDWLISRQRFFGVPIPVWYPLDEAGEPIDGEVIVPDETAPGRPLLETPPGFTRPARCPGGFVGEARHHGHLGNQQPHPATCRRVGSDPELFDAGVPLRPALKAKTSFEPGCFPPCFVLNSNTALFPGRTPASRASSWTQTERKCRSPRATSSPLKPCWMTTGPMPCATGQPRQNLGQMQHLIPQNPKQIKIGRRLAIKVLNAAKFVYRRHRPAVGYRCAGPTLCTRYSLRHRRSVVVDP